MINIYFADKRQPNENSSTKYLYIIQYAVVVDYINYFLLK